MMLATKAPQRQQHADADLDAMQSELIAAERIAARVSDRKPSPNGRRLMARSSPSGGGGIWHNVHTSTRFCKQSGKDRCTAYPCSITVSDVALTHYAAGTAKRTFEGRAAAVQDEALLQRNAEPRVDKDPQQALAAEAEAWLGRLKQPQSDVLLAKSNIAAGVAPILSPKQRDRINAEFSKQSRPKKGKRFVSRVSRKLRSLQHRRGVTKLKHITSSRKPHKIILTSHVTITFQRKSRLRSNAANARGAHGPADTAAAGVVWATEDVLGGHGGSRSPQQIVADQVLALTASADAMCHPRNDNKDHEAKKDALHVNRERCFYKEGKKPGHAHHRIASTWISTNGRQY